MTPRLINPPASVSRSIASGDSAKIAADHLRRGLAFARFIDMESAEPDTFQNLKRVSSPRVFVPAAVPRDQEMASTYSAWRRMGVALGSRDAVASVQESPATFSQIEPPSGEKIRSGMDGSRRNPVLTRASGEPGRHPYSRRLAPPQFTPASVNLRPSWATSLNLAGASVPALFGKFRGNGVGALVARVFKVSPSNTIRLAAPRLSNSEFAA